MKTRIFDANNSNANNLEEDIKKVNIKTWDLPVAQSYSHTIAILYMYWREIDVTDYLELFVLFYLYDSLYMTNNTGVVMAKHGYYNLNQLDSNLTNNLQLSINNEISANITNI